MGREIDADAFTEEDFSEFQRRLARETQLLCEMLEEGVFEEGEPTVGFELEAWLLDKKGHPAPLFDALQARLDEPLLVPELAAFNLELNGTPAPLSGQPFSALHRELGATWSRCSSAASALGGELAMIGSLPTAEPHDFSLKNISPTNRYRALNDQVLRLRGGRPLQIAIEGRDRLRTTHHDVMLESAATAFQLHIKVSPQQAWRYFNASKVLAAPLVALGANSPYLFGADLWDETRIPLFEQAISVETSSVDKRVGFGIRYARHSIAEVFQANLHRYPVMLPQLLEEPEEHLPHLSLHNGTIWRWTRPIIGFGPSGKPHLRIEFRVLPSGPSTIDCIANAALYFGAVRELVEQDTPMEERLPFEQAASNFYAAARDGLGAEITGVGGGSGTARKLLLEFLLPAAHRGLERLGVEPAERRYWLGITEERLTAGINGTVWQRDWVARHGTHWEGLVAAYLEQQNSGAPVHGWRA